MNKKVSTLLTVALTLGGSLLTSSAFAQTFAQEMTKDGTSTDMYHVYVDSRGSVDEQEGSGLLSPDGAYFVEATEANKKNPKYMWSITRSTINNSTYYVLKNAEGTTFPAVEVGGNKYTAFVQETNAGNEDELTYATDGTGSSDAYVGFSVQDGKIVPVNSFTDAWNYKLVKVEEGEVHDTDLNKLFNEKGFNFAVKPDVKDATVEGNLFDNNGLIWAYELESEYTISKAGANGKDLVVPAGIYFFSERVLAEGKEVVESADDIDWVNSTLIAVSQKETVETTTKERSNAQGFKLINVKGSEFVFEKNTSDFKIGHLPIYNACFSISDNHKSNSDYPYQISVPTFYYQANAKDTDDKALTKATAIKLGSLTFTDKETEYLTTISKEVTSSEYIFKLSDSAVVDGKSLLKTTKEAAVYNIKFVDGLSVDKALFGKYLTNGVSGSDFIWEAKGSDIANLNHPSFQYTITKVSKEDGDKYVNVTFTNRETNEGFTLNLFPEGENRYSVAIKDADATTEAIENTPISVTPISVKRNSYAVEAGTPSNINENLIIELVPASVDEYAGFVNVEDGTVRTIRFARDKFDTSSQWFLGNVHFFEEEVYDAAQFKLEKAKKASTIARTFVYNNESTKTVDDVQNADKVSAYTYELQHIYDGSETGVYLYDNNGIKYDSENKTAFYIKENADGSVSLFGTNGAFATSGDAGKKVTNADKNTSLAADIDNWGNPSLIDGNNRSSIYANVTDDHKLKTYLETEAPNVSWEGENGHVTLRNNSTGVVGNYVSMNEDREGILVSNDANVFYLQATDKNAIVPSFFISKGKGENSNAESERMFLFNPVDSVNYQVNTSYDPNYELALGKTKAIFKAGTLNGDYDKLNTWIKGENRDVAMEADNNGVWAGLNRFKFQIVETPELDGNYNIRQASGSNNGYTVYLASINEKLYFTGEKALAMAINIESVEAPTSNEGVSASEVKVVAQNGSVVVKNAAGKNVVVSTILGQVVANEVLTSDNATINVPAGIVVVAVEGESFKVNVK